MKQRTRHTTAVIKLKHYSTAAKQLQQHQKRKCTNTEEDVREGRGKNDQQRSIFNFLKMEYMQITSELK